ncbi:MAG: branched-chain amino acid ABC transporter permease [Nitrosomonas sp.]|jgi:branched-chain amino acid transport system permease protein|nr:branched-chain amino acid ABC transporter permease [Nitrosomonas sp.]
MRSGDFKETTADLIVISDSAPVWIWSVILLLALIVAPHLFNAYLLSFLILILITGTGALGLHLLTGSTGLISLGHVGFLLLGAYAYAVPVAKYGLSPVLGFLLAGVVPSLAAIIVGIPSLRLKGLYLAITTLAFSFIISYLVLEMSWLTNGARGIAVLRPELFGFNFDSDTRFIYLCLVIAVLTLFAVLNIERSRVGRAFMAVRDNDIAARAMGINLQAYKLRAFMTSAFISGIAGALFGIYLSFVSVEGFPFLMSIEALAILIVGGLGSTLGVALGTVFIVLLPEVGRIVLSMLGDNAARFFSTGANELRSVLYGLAIILFLRFEPRGLVGMWRDLKRLWTNWPLRY